MPLTYRNLFGTLFIEFIFNNSSDSLLCIEIGDALEFFLNLKYTNKINKHINDIPMTTAVKLDINNDIKLSQVITIYCTARNTDVNIINNIVIVKNVCNTVIWKLSNDCGN